MNLKIIHTTRNGNLHTRNPSRIIGSKKFDSFRNIFRLTSEAKRCVGNKHFFILTAAQRLRLLTAPGTHQRGQGRTPHPAAHKGTGPRAGTACAPPPRDGRRKADP